MEAIIVRIDNSLIEISRRLKYWIFFINIGTKIFQAGIYHQSSDTGIRAQSLRRPYRRDHICT